MPLTEPEEKALKAALLTTRVLAFAMCCAAPLIYALVYGVVVLEGRWLLFLQGFAAVPWGHPLLLGLLTVSATTLAGVFVLPGLLVRARHQNDLPPLSLLRARSITSFALAEAIAIFGLVLGFVLGPAVATLSLALMLIPLCFGPLLFPSEPAWREFCERRDTNRHV